VLNPDQGQLYTDCLRPPPNHRFQDAVGTTYSLDLATLLTVPLHLTLFSADRPVEELMGDGVSLLEALRRTARHLSVFTQTSRTQAPRSPHVLFPLLEPVVLEAMPPSGSGTFHPKLWLLRFQSLDGASTRLRLLVLSRNLTEDRSWDLILTLEGTPAGRRIEGNEALARLLTALPDMAIRPPAPEHRERVDILADLVLHTEWEPPGAFEEVRFHALGLDGAKPWLPARSDELVVVSPFLSEETLTALADSTRNPLALVSRPEIILAMPPEALRRFEQTLVLAEEAELEDGEEADPDARTGGPPPVGLHAKAYLTTRGPRTHLYVGSANATVAALGAGRNVELMAELVGRSGRVGKLADFFGDQGLGRILTEFQADDAALEPLEPEVMEAQAALDRARQELSEAGLTLRFSPVADSWGITLVPRSALALARVAEARAWLVTRTEETRGSVLGLREGRPVELPQGPLALLSSLVAFELRAEAAEERVRFVLSLVAEGLPEEERDAAILRDVIRNREGFLRYVFLLLADAGGDTDVFGGAAARWDRPATGGLGEEDNLPLFEHLTRAFCREPSRLDAVRRLLADLEKRTCQGPTNESAPPVPPSPNGDQDVVPPQFRELWAVFEDASEQGL